ncbi:MAG: exosortase J [Gammaproteobacteria bacterium]|nr:exosortase J [Gammaproteobacteria bacterium]MDE2346000.1 exosortase J [Gammaproteobacteria bacterium]
MSSISSEIVGAPGKSIPRVTARRRAVPVLCAMALVVGLGLWLCCAYPLRELWTFWTTDPLRSIGLAIPIASLVLLVRAWRWEDLNHGGTWWGLPVVLGALLLARTAYTLPLQFYLHSAYGLPSFEVIPFGALLFAFTSGVVLLFAGAHAWRRAWFALLLLLFVNPVPHGFDVLVDLPLQYFAAHVARGFAALIGVPVSTGVLQMMFTPRLGMFIAPGCDGLRGAVAMGYLALVIGYLYRLTWLRWALYVLGAVLLAYVFNLLRLCGVVIYYWFAMRLPAIADHATLADYLIGGVLFFCAALFLFSIPRRWRPCT